MVTPIPTPAMRSADQEKSLYYGPAMAQLRILKQQMQLGGLKIANRRVQIDSGVSCICSIVYNIEEVWIVFDHKDEIEQIGRFACKHHLASSGYNPNANTDAWVLHWDSANKTWTASSEKEIQYGNIDWTNGSKGSVVLSWKGPLTRYFPMDIYTNVAGVTTLDEIITVYIESFPVEKNVYTPFGASIYCNGRLKDTAPKLGTTATKVLGAAYNESGMIVIVGTNYRGINNPAGSVGGHFWEIFRVQNKVWTRLHYQTAARPVVAWFFNSTGTEAQTVFNGNLCKFTIDGNNVAYSETACCSGTKTETRTANTTELSNVEKPTISDIATQNIVLPSNFPGLEGAEIGTESNTSIVVNMGQECIVAADYKLNTPVFAKTILIGETSTSFYQKNYNKYGLLEMVPYEPPGAFQIEGPDVWTGSINDYAVTGGCPPFTYTAPTEACGMGTVSATDSSGNSASKSVRIPGGSWVLVDGYSTATGYDVAFKTSGDTRIYYAVAYSGCGYKKDNYGNVDYRYSYDCTSTESNTFDPSGPSCGAYVTGTPTCVSDCAFWDEPNSQGFTGTCWSSFYLGSAVWSCP